MVHISTLPLAGRVWYTIYTDARKGGGRVKRVLCLLLTGLLLPLCCCAPKSPAAEAPVPSAVAVPLDAPTLTATPQPTPTATPTPTCTPTPTPTPSPTPVPTDTPVPTPTPRPVVEIVEEMAVYYARDGEKAMGKVADLLEEMAAADPDAARKWNEIMGRWHTLDDRIEVNIGVLPDGLPDTDELCIVVLGYQLNANGTMKNQLEQRLKVALKSAKKYPNAYIVCTGGGTAAKKKDATEAGQMSAWLKKQGIRKDRIIVEKGSHTTAANARLTLNILLKDYPQVKQLAIVSGDYHVRVGVLLFEAEAMLRAGPGAEPPIQVVSNAGCKTKVKELSTQYRAGGLIELAGNGRAASALYQNVYNMNKYPALP